MVFTEELAESGLSRWRQKIEAQVGDVDGIRLFDKKRSMGIVTGDRAGKGKGQQ